MERDIEKDIVNKVYKFYGTDSGVLFGLQSGLRSGIEAVIFATIRVIESEYTIEKKEVKNE